jgi:hypothetical protein
MYAHNQLLTIAKKFEEKLKSDHQYVYHIKSHKFKGKYIYPLSELQDIYPDIYRQEIKKYKDRNTHPNIKINMLDAQWKDCVNLSTLNPIKIFQLEELLGIPGYKQSEDVEIFRFDINDLEDFEMCLYDDNKSPRKADAYKKLNPKTYKETQFIPTATVKYFAKSKEDEEHPLIFAYVNHVMVKGNLPINKADIIKFKANITK